MVAIARQGTVVASPQLRLNWRLEWGGHALLWAYLASPVFLSLLLGSGVSWRDPLWAFNAVASLLWVATLFVLPVRPRTLHALLLPLYLTTAVDLFLLHAFGSRLSSAFMSILVTDASETPEFFAVYWVPVAAITTLSLLVVSTGLWCVRHVPTSRFRTWTLVFPMGLLAMYAAVFARNMAQIPAGWQTNLFDVFGKEMSSPMGAVFQAGVTQQLFSQYAHMRAQRSAHTFGAQQTAPIADDEIVVWVIGESSRPMNWQLFGYDRPTTPLLKKAEGLIPLTNLRTTAATTSYAVPSMLSLRPIDQWNQVLAERSVISAFEEAGFETWWLSTQEVDSWGGPIPHIAAEASTRRYFERSHDGALLPALRDIVSQGSQGKKTFVVVHTKGSHFDFKRRYPAEFARFNSGNADRRRDLVDTYDNSILYTDWVLSQIIETLRQSQRKAVLLYASDHGENILDDERQLFGHAMSTEFDLATAGFLWTSPGVKSQRTDHLKHLANNARKPLSVSDLGHTMLHVAGIEARGLDTTRSLFSVDYRTRPQIFRRQTGEIASEPVRH